MRGRGALIRNVVGARQHHWVDAPSPAHGRGVGVRDLGSLSHANRILVLEGSMANGGFDTSRHERLRSPERLEMLRVVEVVQRLVDEDTRHVIDVGAGTGVWTEAFINAGVMDVTAVDSSSIMIEQLQRLVPDARRMQTEAH